MLFKTADLHKKEKEKKERSEITDSGGHKMTVIKRLHMITESCNLCYKKR